VEYETPDVGKISASQREAQPMGKILSFSILCIINFAVCRKALELDRGCSIPISEFPGLINGDDCCFPIKNFDHWVGCSAMVGLFNSVGKTFTSREFIEMNSRIFLLTSYQEIDGDYFECKYLEVPFVNFGLMKGMVRSEGGPDLCISDRQDLVGACSRMGMCSTELVRGFEFMRDELMFLFRHYHNKYLQSPELSGIPYYIPAWLGGLGLAVGFEPQKLIPDLQLKAASIVFRNYMELKPKNMATDKLCIFDELVNRRQDFLMSQAGMNRDERKVNFQVLETEGGSKVDLEIENQRVYTDTIEYFWRTFTLPMFFNNADADYLAIAERASRKRLYHNSTLWKATYHQAMNRPEVKPLEWYKLWHQSFKDIRPIIKMDSSRANREHIMMLLGVH